MLVAGDIPAHHPFMEIPEHLHRQLIAFGIKWPDQVRWVRRDRINTLPMKDHNHYRACVCQERRMIKMKFIELNKREIGLGQCTNCRAVIWCDWDTHVVKVGALANGP